MMKETKDLTMSELAWETARDDAKRAGKSLDAWIQNCIFHANVCDAAAIERPCAAREDEVI